LALATLTASAAEIKIEAQNSNGQGTTADQRVYELGIKESINKNFAGDIVIKNYRTETTNVLSTRYEAGLTGTVPVGPVSAYTRVSVGENYTSGATGFSYYAVEPGVIAPITFVPGLALSVGYRFQDAFSDNRNDTTRTWRSKLGYDLNKTSTVYIGYDQQRGDSEANITKVGYVHRF
jgi:predicted porin